MDPRILTLSSFARLPEPQHVIRTLICNCCSARRVAVWKQQSQTPSCFSQGSRRTGWPEQRSDSARLRLGPNRDALAVIRDPRVTAFEPPGGLAVRAAILAQTVTKKALETTRKFSEPNPFCSRNALLSRRSCNRRLLRIVIPSEVEESLEFSVDALRTAHTTTPSTAQRFNASTFQPSNRFSLFFRRRFLLGF